MTGWLTWQGLELEPEERRACRRAGLEAADFARLGPLEIVGATAGEISEPRALLLGRRASLFHPHLPLRYARKGSAGVIGVFMPASAGARVFTRAAWQAAEHGTATAVGHDAPVVVRVEPVIEAHTARSSSNGAGVLAHDAPNTIVCRAPVSYAGHSPMPSWLGLP